MTKIISLFLIIGVLGYTAYFTLTYYATFSEGSRSGQLIKFSKKGMFFKTYEGEISQGISGAQLFQFSVEEKEQEIIEKLDKFQGKYVKVRYKERYRTFPWWGDTKYFIESVTPEKSPHFNSN